MGSPLLLLGLGKAGSGVATLIDTLSPTGAWSFSRDLVSSWAAAARYTENTAKIDALKDQSGNVRDLLQTTAARRPVIGTAGLNSRACGVFDSVNITYLDTAGGDPLSDFITASTGYMVISFRATTIDANSANPETNEGLICDSTGGEVGLFLKTGQIILAYNFDGTRDSNSIAVTTNMPYVAEWRHDGGTVYGRVNGGTEFSAASGNTGNTGFPVRMGNSLSGNAAQSVDGAIFECATFSTVPSLTDRDAIVTDWMTWIGATRGTTTSYPLESLSPTGAFSFSRKLLSAYGGSFYTTNTGVVDSLKDQSGSSRDLGQGTGGFRPTPSTAGPNSIACGDFDGTDDFLVSSAALSTFISAGSGYLIISVMVDAVTLNNAASYQNNGFVSNTGVHFGLFAKNVGGTTPTFLAFNWDGNEDAPTGTAFSLAKAYVLTWRHEGGTLYLSVNGGTETTVASGNTSDLTGTLRLGIAGAGTAVDAKIFEMATFSSIPTAGQRGTLIQDFGSYIGAF